MFYLKKLWKSVTQRSAVKSRKSKDYHIAKRLADGSTQRRHHYHGLRHKENINVHINYVYKKRPEECNYRPSEIGGKSRSYTCYGSSDAADSSFKRTRKQPYPFMSSSGPKIASNKELLRSKESLFKNINKESLVKVENRSGNEPKRFVDDHLQRMSKVINKDPAARSSSSLSNETYEIKNHNKSNDFIENDKGHRFSSRSTEVMAKIPALGLLESGKQNVQMTIKKNENSDHKITFTDEIFKQSNSILSIYSHSLLHEVKERHETLKKPVHSSEGRKNFEDDPRTTDFNRHSMFNLSNESNRSSKEESLKQFKLLSEEMELAEDHSSDSLTSNTVKSEVIVKKDYPQLSSSPVPKNDHDKENQKIRNSLISSLNDSFRKIKETTLLEKTQSFLNYDENRRKNNNFQSSGEYRGSLYINKTKEQPDYLDKHTMTDVNVFKSTHVQTDRICSLTNYDMKRRFFEEKQDSTLPKPVGLNKVSSSKSMAAPDQFKIALELAPQRPFSLMQSEGEEFYSKLKVGKLIRSKSKPDYLDKVEFSEGAHVRQDSNFMRKGSVCSSALTLSNSLYQQNQSKMKNDYAPVMRMKKIIAERHDNNSSLSEHSQALMSVSTLKSSASSSKWYSSIPDITSSSLRKSLERIPESANWGKQEAVYALYRDSPKMAKLLGVFAEL